MDSSVVSMSRKSSTGGNVLISARGASRKFCHDPSRSLRYTVSDSLRELFARRPQPGALRAGEFWALRNVSFQVRRGESVGIMGRNGAGKSTLLKLMLGSLRLTEGEIVTSGRLALLSEHGLGFDPQLTGRENIYMTAAILEISRQRVDQAFNQIVAFAEVGDFIDAPFRTYSSGMRTRLGFSVAMYLDPDILLVDEVLAVGDIGFQRRCIQHVQSYLERGGSLVLVSHNPHLVQFICERCLILDQGVTVVDGGVVEGVARYLDAARAAARDPLTLDPALAGIPPPVSPSENTGLEIDDFGIEPIGAESLHTASPARVHIRYRSDREMNIRWGFCLLTSDLETQITCESLLQPFRIVAGAGELSSTIPNLPFASGRYALRVAIMDPRTELPFALGGFHTPPRYFTVHAPASLRNNYRMFSRDLVALENLQWERRELGDNLGNDRQGRSA